jgi:sulfur carrier protein
MSGISIVLNGGPVAADAGTLAELLAERGIDPSHRHIAVAINNVVVPRGEWAGVRLAEGDRIEIVQPMKGG